MKICSSAPIQSRRRSSRLILPRAAALTLSHSAVSVWEHRAAMERLRAEGRAQVDEEALFRMVEQMRTITDTAQSTTRKARRDAERRSKAGAAAPRDKPAVVPPPDDIPVAVHDTGSASASGAGSVAPRTRSRRTVQRIWQMTGHPMRADIVGPWRPYEALPWPKQQMLLQAAATAGHLIEAGEVTTRGSLALLLTRELHRSVHGGTPPVPRPRDYWQEMRDATDRATPSRRKIPSPPGSC